MPRYTLHELRDAALQECRNTFQLVSDISTYTFERRAIAQADRQMRKQDKEQLAIYLAYWHSSKHDDRVYAVVDPDASEIAIYHGKPGDSLAPVHKLFLNPEKLQNYTKKSVKPFDLAIEHPLLKSTNDVSYAKKLSHLTWQSSIRF